MSSRFDDFIKEKQYLRDTPLEGNFWKAKGNSLGDGTHTFQQRIQSVSLSEDGFAAESRNSFRICHCAGNRSWLRTICR
jgi:hypothetical protein